MIHAKAQKPKSSTHHFRYSLLLCAALGLSVTSSIVPAEDKEATTPATEESNSQPAAKTGRILPDPTQQQMAALAKAKLPDTEVLWLETQQESFLGLQQQAISGDAMGGILILPHDRTSPDWPQLIHGLRSGLPRQGWHSLSIALPHLPEPTLPKRSEDGASAAAPSAAPEDLKKLTETISERIESGLRQLESLGAKRFILMGVGTGGYWASKYAESAGTQRPLNLALINAQQPDKKLEQSFADLNASLEIPTLDLFHGSGLRNPTSLASQVEQQAQQRLDQARRKERQYYIQRRLPPAATLPGVSDKRLLSTFKGLFEKHLMHIQPTAEGAKSMGEAMPGK